MSQEDNKEFEMAVGTSTMLESNIMDDGENFYTPIETATEPEPEPTSETSWSGIKNDTGQLCRSCANSSDYLIPIYEGEGLEHQLEYKIQKHLPIQVSSTDTLPLQLCYQCASTLIAWDSMINSCLEADKKLRAMQEAGVEVKHNVVYDDSQAEPDTETLGDADAAIDAVDSDDEPLIASKARLLSERIVASKHATPLKKKILSKAKNKIVAVKNEKTVQVSKEGEDKERSDALSEDEKCSSRSWIDVRFGLKSEEESVGNEDVIAEAGRWKRNSGRYANTCNLCNKRLFTKQGFSRHMKNHFGDRSETCHICGKCFLEKKDISRHVREVHEKVKKFGCDVCGRTFATKSTRNDHRTTHTGERTYVCHICGKTFKTANCVYVHRRTHSDYAPHKCGSCNKSFRTRQRLKNHLAIHTGEKPYMCQICGKRFITKSQVNCHVEIHSCSRAHICPICGISYNVRKYLRVHLKSHHSAQSSCIART